MRHGGRVGAAAAKEVTARRRELAQQIRPWQLAAAKQAAKVKPAAKAPAKAAAARGKGKRAAVKG